LIKKNYLPSSCKSSNPENPDSDNYSQSILIKKNYLPSSCKSSNPENPDSDNYSQSIR
jgi:hypothetical protein